jgi:hypothetical protein
MGGGFLLLAVEWCLWPHRDSHFLLKVRTRGTAGRREGMRVAAARATPTPFLPPCTAAPRAGHQQELRVHHGEVARAGRGRRVPLPVSAQAAVQRRRIGQVDGTSPVVSHGRRWWCEADSRHPHGCHAASGSPSAVCPRKPPRWHRSRNRSRRVASHRRVTHVCGCGGGGGVVGGGRVARARALRRARGVGWTRGRVACSVPVVRSWRAARCCETARLRQGDAGADWSCLRGRPAARCPLLILSPCSAACRRRVGWRAAGGGGGGTRLNRTS